MPIKFKFFACFLCALGLSVLISCSSQTANNTNSPAPATGTSMSQMPHSSKQININSAILSELDKLEAKLGIPALSNKIQGSRPYGKVEELVSKNVITQQQFDQIKDMVTIADIKLEGEAKDIDYMTKLGLMKGHLYVAKELLDLQKPEQAEPHIGHPVEEIYADVEDQLSERKVPEFKNSLIALQDEVKAGAKNAEKVSTGYQSSLKSIDIAINALPESERQSPSFVLQVINGLLDTANSEYGAAIANNKITQVIEYQDSRGFVVYANELFKGISGAMLKSQPEAEKTIETKLAELSKTWVAVTPPATPVKTSDQVSALIKDIESSTQKVAKAS
ncbi:helix-hairpin-helix domain-containing protein [Cyanobacteria bacterium FACHB-63]|nr:helix-hairpin-helix domain-containing protein [Cyanobacteria bacterium FACHB-63]